jgi:hypothetical protein
MPTPTEAAAQAHDRAAAAHEKAAYECGSTEYQAALDAAYEAGEAASEAMPEDFDLGSEAWEDTAFANAASEAALEHGDESDGNEDAEAAHREAAEWHRKAAAALRA